MVRNLVGSFDGSMYLNWKRVCCACLRVQHAYGAIEDTYQSTTTGDNVDGPLKGQVRNCEKMC